MLGFDYTNLIKNKYNDTDITQAQVLNYEKVCATAHQAILADKKADILGFYDLPEQDIAKIINFATTARAKYDCMVVLGIGGSALGNIALYEALRVAKSLDKKLYVIDNVDPLLVADVLGQIDISKTIFNVITKSGTTAETMSTFMIILDILKDSLGDNYKQQLVITTDKKKGFLRQIIQQEKISDFIVPDNVGGRFSVFTDVGLVSSAFVGIDIAALLAGAKAMKKRCAEADYQKNPAYLNGLLHYLHLLAGRNIAVMMPYANSLYLLADWYRQLWAESLGKRYSTNGAEVYVGQTPVKALGTTDQHSQVQLYTQGPDDKVITFLEVKKFEPDYLIPHVYTQREEVNYLCGKYLSDLLNTERLATEIALNKANRPNANIIFPTLDEYHLGEFIFMHQVQTVFTGKLLGINPLDQPGVENGKIATYAMMGKKGYATDAEAANLYKKYKQEEGKLL